MTMIVANTIPKDLFPLKENQYSLSWATKTYPYAHLFALPFDHKFNPNNDHVSMWRSKAIQLRAELTSIGKDKGTGKILEIANIQYNLKIKGTDLPCSSIYDVLTIVSEKDWYNSDKPTRINQIYMMVYGITRQGFDQWLVELENEWMNKYNVTYITKSGRQDLIFNYRGCVYSLLKKVFNNSIIKQFKQTMWYNHQEFICVRLKQNRFGNDIVDVKPIECRWGQLYLCTKKNESNDHEDLQKVSCYDPNLLPLLDRGRKWVEQCINEGINVKELHNVIDKWSSECTLQPFNNESNSSK